MSALDFPVRSLCAITSSALNLKIDSIFVNSSYYIVVRNIAVQNVSIRNMQHCCTNWTAASTATRCSNSYTVAPTWKQLQQLHCSNNYTVAPTQKQHQQLHYNSNNSTLAPTSTMQDTFHHQYHQPVILSWCDS